MSDYLDFPSVIIDQIVKIMDETLGCVKLEGFMKFYMSLAAGTLDEKISTIFDM